RFPKDRGKPCFLFPDGGAVSYGALEDGTAKIARLLVSRGVVPGDRVLVQCAKTPEAGMLYLATLKVGAVCTPLNTAYTAAEIAYFEKDAEPRVFVRDAVALMHEAAAMAPLHDVMARAANDIASLIYTSGTTERSKGAMLSHGALTANAFAL